MRRDVGHFRVRVTFLGTFGSPPFTLLTININISILCVLSHIIPIFYTYSSGAVFTFSVTLCFRSTFHGEILYFSLHIYLTATFQNKI